MPCSGETIIIHVICNNSEADYVLNEHVLLREGIGKTNMQHELATIGCIGWIITRKINKLTKAWLDYTQWGKKVSNEEIQKILQRESSEIWGFEKLGEAIVSQTLSIKYKI